MPVWPYGCPCGNVGGPGASTPPPYPTPYPTHHPGPTSYPGPGPMVYRPGPPVVSEKSAGVAVVLTLVWLGAGHLYLHRTTPGVLLMVLHVFLWLLLLLFFPLGFIGWLAAFIAATVSCSSIANEENARARSRYR